MRRYDNAEGGVTSSKTVKIKKISREGGGVTSSKTFKIRALGSTGALSKP